MADRTSMYLPPSENESGVTLRTPMTRVLSTSAENLNAEDRRALSNAEETVSIMSALLSGRFGSLLGLPIILGLTII